MWQFGAQSDTVETAQSSLNEACPQGYRPPGRDVSAPTKNYQVWGEVIPSKPEDGMRLLLDNIDEAGWTARLWPWPISTRLWTWAALSTVTNSKASQADLRSARGYLVQKNLGSLRHAFPQNLSDGFECIDVKALDETRGNRRKTGLGWDAARGPELCSSWRRDGCELARLLPQRQLFFNSCIRLALSTRDLARDILCTSRDLAPRHPWHVLLWSSLSCAALQRTKASAPREQRSW